jgi:hypothetical protein
MTKFFFAAPCRVGAALLALASAGCSASDSDPGRLMPGAPPATTPDLSVNVQGALSTVAGDAYESSPLFTKISSLYASKKDPVDIREWISTGAAQAYAQIVPDADAAPPEVTMPRGTVVVRAVYALPDAGADGAVQALTIMVKGPPGTDEGVGDWWFAVTDPSGTPLLDADGGPRAGPAMTECHGCHISRGSGNDFLFGVPTEDRLIPSAATDGSP